MVKNLYELNNTYRVLRKHFGLIRGQNNTTHEPQPKFSVITQKGQAYKITPWCLRSSRTHLYVPIDMLKGIYKLNNTYWVFRKHLGVIRGHQDTKHDFDLKKKKKKIVFTIKVVKGHILDVKSRNIYKKHQKTSYLNRSHRDRSIGTLL